MKKRILALALAGTTAFSVFGAAMSANAAGEQSAQWVSSNDIYKQYTPVAKKIEANSYDNASTRYVKYYMVNTGAKTFYVNSTGKTDSVPTGGEFANTAEGFTVAEEKLADVLEKEYTDSVATTYGHTGYKGTVIIDNKTVNVYFGKDYDSYMISAEGTAYSKTDITAIDQLASLLNMDVVKEGTTNTDALFINGNYYTTAKGALKAYVAKNSLTLYHFDEAGKSIAHADCAAAQKEAQKNWVIAPVYYDATAVNAGDATVKIATSAAENATLADAKTSGWHFNGSTSADTTIYPWTTTTSYKTVLDGYTIEVEQAEAYKTVYLFDFIPYNSTTASSGDIAYAYNYLTTADAAALIDKDGTATSTTWKAETGKGGSYGIRKEVVEDYEDFLSSLVILRDGNYYLSKADFKAEYEDLYVSGYLYDEYTGLTTAKKWKYDLYNIDTLLENIYASSEGNKYLTMNTSEMLYLMQQYDKYIGYIEKAEVEKDAWGDLLVSILENVSEDDFKKSADYKTFVRKAEDYIDAYNDAETSSMIKVAEEKMYELIVSEQTKTVGAADEKKALNADLYSLYFNAKTTADTYTTANAVADATKANLTNYSYLAGVTLLKKTDAAGTTLTSTLVTTPGYYTLYPIADYYEYGNAVKKYAGVTGTAPTDFATDAYEWFWNVYALAKEVNGTNKALSGVVSAVNDALNDAVAGLEVTKPATATAESALDEMIEHYEEVLDFYVTGNGVNEEDFNATYYAAYEAALAYADVAEGAAQVANARYMVEVAAKALTYQGAQVTVSKNDIKTVEAAIKEGQTALKAIKEDKNYNAAQVTALNKAIDQAQDVVDIYNAKYSSSYNTVNYAKAALVGDKDGIVKSDITGAIEAIDAAIEYSEIIMGWAKDEATGKYYYGTENGYLDNGWNKIGSVWYFFNEDGTAKQSEWAKIDGKWYWFNSNAGAAIGWAKVDNEWYYFGGDNAMKTGWVKVDGNWYYLAASGKMTTGWVQVGGKWYYMSKESNSLGQMLANTTVEGYKLGADGAMIEK